MRSGASTPEEVESLLEDALILGDSEAAARLFDQQAVFAADPVGVEARGDRQIERLAAAMYERGFAYVANPRRIVHARGTALVVAEHAINVLRRRPDGSWRYAISLITIQDKGAINDTRDA